MSTEERDKPVNRAALIRRIILGLFPVVSVLLKSWPGFVATSTISVLAIILDKARNRRRAIPFPLYLLIVLTMQAMSMSLILNLVDASDAKNNISLSLQHPEVAMEKWNEIDSKIDLSQEPWPESEYPWIKEFPPLKPGDPKPVIKTASVILAAHNEHKYLERTIKSIIDESKPDQLLEVIVIDDGSDPPLSEITDKMKNEKVKLIRQNERKGLIRSKSHGAAIARGDLIIFLDAHVKPERQWLTPLFRHTNENWKRVVVPVIPILNGDTWRVESAAVGYKMMFDWGMGFNWFDDGNDWVPIMSGGLLAITRRYWHWSGEYDNGMLQWGGENIEQSIRIWLCGGEIVVARDSRVSHVFRPNFPYAVNNTQVNINKVRLAEVWLDQYKEFFYRADPYAQTLVPYMGDTSQREQLKIKLQCKPFQFFVDRFRSVFDRENMLPARHFAIKDEISGKCVEAMQDGILKFGDCSYAQGGSHRPSFRFIPDSLSADEPGLGVLRSMKFANLCFDANAASKDKNGLRILIYHCMVRNENQKGWLVADGGLRWHSSCAGLDQAQDALVFANCETKLGEFLGKTFYGHPNHRFVIFDEQRLDAVIGNTENPENGDHDRN
jgi:glycosyltransferase involved in cell wall biosynthesis